MARWQPPCKFYFLYFCLAVPTATQQKNIRVFSFSLRRGLEDHGLFNINLWNKRNFRRKFIGLILRAHSLPMSRQRNQNLNFLASFNVREWERGGRGGGRWLVNSPKYFINKIYWGQIPLPVPRLDSSQTGEVIAERWQSVDQSSKRANISI